MPNIAITNFCNLQCKYCFADDMIQEEKKYMSFEDFQKVLRFLAVDEAPEVVGIIGGEPTLHPDFDLFLDELLDFRFHVGSKCLIFTNGIKLQPYLPKILKERIDVLINCNSPQFQPQEDYNQLLQTLEMCGEAIEEDLIRCGCNIYLECKDYSYFWNDIVDKYHCPVVRMSLVSPGKCYNVWNSQEKKYDYYSLLKPYVMDFLREAQKRKVKVCFDCNQIPICMLTPEEMSMVVEVSEKLPRLQCDGGLDIDVNLKGFNCFSTYDHHIEIDKFTSVMEVKTYLLMEHLHSLMKNNKGGMCEGCEKGKLHICQGGCLSFSKGVEQ